MKKPTNIAGQVPDQSGFTLIELLIAMALTLFIAGAAATMLSASFMIQRRESDRVDSGADVARAINIMTREIAMSGYSMKNNGIVGADSGPSQLRIRADVNDSNSIDRPGEDILYTLYQSEAADRYYLVRYDVSSPAAGKQTILANRIDSMAIHYYDSDITYQTDPDLDKCDIVKTGGTATELTAPNLGAAKFVVIAVCVNLPARGTPGQSGYQPRSRTVLTNSVALRNQALGTF
jgi:prepilin-type N-terminal cleavage/methylation domain-containing protein